MTDALRELLLADSNSFAEVSRRTGLTRQSLMLFARGERSLRLDLADQLAEFYDLEIVHKSGTK